MLLKNILNIHIDIIKIISTLLLIILFTNLFIFICNNRVQASYSDKFANYPKYEELIKKLQQAHPNWEFEILETGLDWSEVIIAESTDSHGKNVVPKSYSDSWTCSCGKIVEKVWTCASTAAVAYYMDPRNSLNEDYIFQFEQLTYDSKIQTKEGVEAILAPCEYMQGKITYYDKNGKKQTIEKTYIDVIMEAAKEYNISPYHLASRIRQEQGTDDAGCMISGTYKGYEGAYNYFNIKTFGTDYIANGLNWAKQQGWTDPEKSIKGGAKVLANDYISNGQDTLYLQKFDVIDGGDGYFVWQYMTNVSASKTEGNSMRNAYKEMGLINETSKMKFKIPVYKNMPEEISAKPGEEKPVTQDVQINGDAVRVRKGKGTNYDIITKYNKGVILLRIELDNSKDAEGIYWDKVVLPDGTKGYVSRQYLTEIALQTNCEEKYTVKEYTNFRNGPGTSKTVIIRLLSPGQILTVVEKDKYKNVDGEAWYRVKLTDGTYGYVGSKYIEPYDPTKTDKVQVVCTDGLYIRQEPSTSAAIVKLVEKGTVLTRTEKDVKSTDTKYIWDKVTTSSGKVGYVARQNPDTKKLWIEPIMQEIEVQPTEEDITGEPKDDDKEPNNTENPEEQQENVISEKIEIEGIGFKMSDNYIISQPNITIENVKKVSKDIVIKNGTITLKDTDNIGTGYTLTYKDKTYTIVVLGDVNGDGKVNSSDLLGMVKHLNGTVILKSHFLKATDCNLDEKVNSSDLLKTVKHLNGTASISI